MSHLTSTVVAGGAAGDTSPNARFAGLLNAFEGGFVTTIVADGVTIRYRPAAGGGAIRTGEGDLGTPSSTPIPASTETPNTSPLAPTTAPIPASPTGTPLLPSPSTSFSTIDAVPQTAEVPARITATPDVPEETPSSQAEEQASSPPPVIPAVATSARPSQVRVATTIPSPISATSAVNARVSPAPDQGDISEIEDTSVPSTSAESSPATMPLISPSPSLPPADALTATNEANNALRPSATRTSPLPSNTAASATEGEGSGSDKGKSIGAIIGGLVGVFALLALILFAVRWYKRRNKDDREALMRSSWFYGGDVDMPDEDEEKNTRFNRQSRFSLPSTHGQISNRFSHFASSIVNLNPMRNSTRFPQFATLAAGPPRQAAAGYNPNTDVPHPISAVPAGKGGWAGRFFDHPPGVGEYVAGPGELYRSQGAGGQQPDMVSRTSPTISCPFIQSTGAKEDGRWGQSYLPATAPSPAPPGSIPKSSSPTRNLLQRNPGSSTSVYGGIGPSSSSQPQLDFPTPHRPGSDQSMEMLAATPTNTEFTSTSRAKAVIIAKLNAAQPQIHITPPARSDGLLGFSMDDNLRASSQFEYASRGVSMADTTSVYSVDNPSVYHASSQANPTSSPAPTATGAVREVETMYSTASSGIEPDQAQEGARETYLSGATGWVDSRDASRGEDGRQTSNWYNQPGIWDAESVKGAGDAGMPSRKSVKSVRWEEGPVGDGLPRAL